MKDFVLSLVVVLMGLWSGILLSDEVLDKKLQMFSDKMETEYQFKSDEVLAVLKNLEIKQNIIDKMNNPAESLAWYQYRPIWMKEKRITGGAEFFKEYKETLEKAEKEYGVDKMMIVAIIGIESFYGKHQGSHAVLDSLYTLGFHYPKREVFFNSELEQYFLLAREQQWSLPDIKGSYAGAMGMGQFISSSYRNYGVDYNEDGKVDLFNDPVDMIGSIANYFKRHGWKSGKFVAKKIELEEQQIETLVQKKLKLTKKLSELETSKFSVGEMKDKDAVVGVFAFEQKNSSEYWLVAKNFYTITRYNHSAMYALAAFQLSGAIAEAVNNDENNLSNQSK